MLFHISAESGVWTAETRYLTRATYNSRHSVIEYTAHPKRKVTVRRMIGVHVGLKVTWLTSEDEKREVGHGLVMVRLVCEPHSQSKRAKGVRLK